MMEENSASTIIFKKTKSRNFRKKVVIEESDEENDDDLLSKIEETKLLRKIRQRQAGVTAENLLAGCKDQKKKESDTDPYKIKIGGMLDMSLIKNAHKVDDAYDTGIGTAFSAETNRRDEDAEMQKFIEENLAQRKGVTKDEDENDAKPIYQSPEEAALHSVPDYLRQSTSKKNEEMLSNQMLSGIPEVDLGLDAKIKNIEATEDAKQKLIRESLMKKSKPSEFVPKNMAVNFVQHSRFTVDQNATNKAKKQKVITEKEVVEPVVGGGVKISTVAPKKSTQEKATDDFHYEKFRKQFKRH